MKGDEFYDSIQLTEEEVKLALLEGRKRKYFYERSKEYWDGLEIEIDHVNIKPKYTREVKIKVGTIKVDRSLPAIKE